MGRTQPQHDTRHPNRHANGTRLAYLEQGHGEPVWSSSTAAWMTCVPGACRWKGSLSTTVSSPTAGATITPMISIERGPEYSALLHAEDLAGLVAALGLGPAHLVTSSFGGYVALCFAASHLAAVRTLVLASRP